MSDLSELSDTQFSLIRTIVVDKLNTKKRKIIPTSASDVSRCKVHKAATCTTPKTRAFCLFKPRLGSFWDLLSIIGSSSVSLTSMFSHFVALGGILLLHNYRDMEKVRLCLFDIINSDDL